MHLSIQPRPPNSTTHAQGNCDNDHIVGLRSQEISWHVPVVSSTGWAPLLLIHAHKSKDASGNQTLTLRHATSQRISSAHLRLTGRSWWKTTCVSSTESQTSEGKQNRPYSEMLVWLSSHNRKHLKPVEQMLGRGSERLPEARGH